VSRMRTSCWMSLIKKYLKRFRYTLTFLAIFLAWMLLRPDPTPQLYQLTGTTMGTTYRVQLWQFPEGTDDQELADGIQSRLHRVDREQMSVYAPDSEVSRFNAAPAGQWFPVSDDLAFVVEQALAFSELTGGFFDITVAPLVERWGFGADRPQGESAGRVPSEREVQELLSLVGHQNLEVRRNPPELRKLAPLNIDLGGIAKGYGADQLADYFDMLGLEDYFIEVGGELRIKGFRPDGQSWVAAIERPTQGANQVHETVRTNGRSLALAGSGDYRNYFIHDGERLSHEIDPFTGQPVEHGLAATYVIADTAMAADALTTAFMVMGLDRSRALAEQMGIAAYFIYRDDSPEGFSETYTAAFSEYLER